MKHLDLFSGIGGASLAVDTVWGRENVEHIFVENDKFCTQVLKKHWPQAEIHGDIRTFTNTTNAQSSDRTNTRTSISDREIRKRPFILTGGFPCQPFSQAGRRKGTEDDRHLWPEMLRVIREFKPEWVIGENVAGFVTWGEGLVLEQVCTDLEKEGYEVQPFIIPAVAVNAPHRRDRVWIVAHANDKRRDDGFNHREERHIQTDERIATENKSERQGRKRGIGAVGSDVENSISKRSGGGLESSGQVLGCTSTEVKDERPDWSRNWLEVATELCSVDDGLPVELDGFKLSKSRHRAEQLKGYGNAWVPQVAIEIMKIIKSIDEKE